MNNALARVDIFAGLSPAELDILQESSFCRRYPKNTVIITEGDSADALYLITAGRVKVYCSESNGKEYIINTLTDGEYFGELAMLDDEKRSASIRTMEPCTFQVIERDDFERIYAAHPNMQRVLIRNLAGRVRCLTDVVKSLALQDVYGRVARVLTGMAKPRDAGSQVIDERLTQQEIADRVGASREMVARILKDLTVGEYIRFEGRRIVINGKLPASY